MVKKIGITGQEGFLGRHLYNTLGLHTAWEIVPFKRSFFKDPKKLGDFVSQCDIIVHLAAMNRHEDPEVIYNTNVELVEVLIAACVHTGSKPHILFSSSTQEESNSRYGKSKKEGKELFINWAKHRNGKFTSLRIPNVFGPFGKPNYNSVVATFCHKIVRNEIPTVIQDNEVGLIYVNDLIQHFVNTISETSASEKIGSNSFELTIAPDYHIKVSKLLSLLNTFKKDYMEKGIFPNLANSFEKALFNTFRCYIPQNHYPVKYTQHTDPRGSFVEIARTQTSGQFSFSTTVPGITRGNHFHTRKAERFAVIKGKALIQLRKVDSEEIIDYYLDGEEPAYVDMPIWYTHNIKNIGDDELLTLFWINEPYNPDDADTFFVEV
ncbi:SDR family oxidoreductase [Aggregatimonas sangjinii]|uniref:SDR family oxidoreductase n=1 Tax=Aggregatimonas sangjinii TaxID=2583587 RepID=A0A5B7SJR7_9FLAO|nr:NAD-dependent epimerase/dehydratase family protein [Aggregatimonas sangjinii]QCW98805.1 SDR family oxidoreductase [Aggregatimonas sangjinii]